MRQYGKGFRGHVSDDIQMTLVTDAAIRLRDVCNENGDEPAAPGATDEQIVLIKRMFSDLGFPLPTALLDVYRVTLAIPGILRDDSVLHAPCVFDHLEVGDVRFLVNEKEDADKENVLWLGRGTTDDLIIDRSGKVATEPDFQDDGSVLLVDPTDFETAFMAYVRTQEAELRSEFEATQTIA